MSELEYVPPGQVAWDRGWADAWEGLKPQPPDQVDERQVYLEAYRLGTQERDSIPAYHVDCDGLHAAGQCPLRPITWWERQVDRLARIARLIQR